MSVVFKSFSCMVIASMYEMIFLIFSDCSVSMKLVYFMIGSGVIKAGHEVSKVVSEKSPEESSEMTTFIFGCVFALVMDVIVGLQVTKYYPSTHMLSLRDRSRRLWAKFERRVLQIDYSSSSSTTTQFKDHRKGSMDAGDMSTC